MKKTKAKEESLGKTLWKKGSLAALAANRLKNNAKSKAEKPSAKNEQRTFQEQNIAANMLMSGKSRAPKMRGFQTFKAMREGIQTDVDQLHTAFNGDVSLPLVRNVVAYCRCVCSDEINHMIEQNVFDAIMSKRFNLTIRTMLDSMFQVASKQLRPPIKMTVNHLAELILLFLSPNIKRKADFAFSVYDINNRGCISKSELRSILAPMLADIPGDDHDEEEDLVGYFVDLVEARIDQNSDHIIELHEFQDLVKKDAMWLQFLGPCLPSPADTAAFRNMMEGLTVFDVQAKFRSELKYLMRTVEPKSAGTFGGLFPFRLELP